VRRALGVVRELDQVADVVVDVRQAQYGIRGEANGGEVLGLAVGDGHASPPA
jgi:hypothetical protein